MLAGTPDRGSPLLPLRPGSPATSSCSAWLLAREAMVPQNYGAPQAATRLAEQARQGAGDRPTAAATLAAATAARTYALSHQD
ncbi:hypothetical protein [Streptomyces osmaniensis]|uniref:hypothetical protein n=1 Tax=Streptomyces osmaniensis TaxID=593134 RepID=UPI001C3293AE|nr:hypothetical protein KJK32_45695 [Streptomyces sp. JCM17656]